jgi:hypothetical protein
MHGLEQGIISSDVLSRGASSQAPVGKGAIDIRYVVKI